MTYFVERTDLKTDDLCMHVWVLCVSVCVCVCGEVVVSLAQGLRSQSSSPTQAIFHLIYLPPTSPTSPPSYGWVPGIKHLLGRKLKAFSHDTAGPGGTSGAHTTYGEESLFSCEFLARVTSLAPGALLARLTVPA